MPGLYDRPVLAIDPGMHTTTIKRADADAAGRWAITGSDDKTVRVWSLADGSLLRTIRLPVGPGEVGKVYAVAMSPDGTLIAAGGWTRWTDADRQQQIYLFKREESGELDPTIDGLPRAALHLRFCTGWPLCLAAMLGEDRLRIYSRSRDWAEVARDRSYGGDSYGVAFARDGRLATTGHDGKVRLYARGRTGDLKPVLVTTPGGNYPSGIAFSPDGSRLAVGY